MGWPHSSSGHFTLLNDPLARTGAFEGTKPQAINDLGTVVCQLPGS
jgi:hypothetical protein